MPLCCCPFPLVQNIVSLLQSLPFASIAKRLLVANYFVWRFDFILFLFSRSWRFPRCHPVTRTLELSFCTVDLNLFPLLLTFCCLNNYKHSVICFSGANVLSPHLSSFKLGQAKPLSNLDAKNSYTKSPHSTDREAHRDSRRKIKLTNFQCFF